MKLFFITFGLVGFLLPQAVADQPVDCRQKVAAFADQLFVARVVEERVVFLKDIAQREKTTFAEYHKWEMKDQVPDKIHVRGYPTKNVVVVGKADQTYRIYLTKDEHQAVLEDPALFSSNWNYQTMQKGVLHSYRDLSGVQLYHPDYIPESVTEKRPYYVDVVLAERLPVVELEKNATYLLPTPSLIPKYLHEAYRKYREGNFNELSPSELMQVREMTATGALIQPLRFEVHLMSTGKVTRRQTIHLDGGRPTNLVGASSGTL